MQRVMASPNVAKALTAAEDNGEPGPIVRLLVLFLLPNGFQRFFRSALEVRGKAVLHSRMR